MGTTVKLKKHKNSVVILANQHNPTVFLGNFLKESGIVTGDEEIKKESSIVTPAFTQVIFNNSDSIQVEPHRLKIEGNFGELPFQRAISYMRSLPHIEISAIGINFSYEIHKYNLDKLTNWMDKDKYIPLGVNILINDDSKARRIVNLKYDSKKDVTLASINCEYKFENTKYGDLPIDIIEERKKNIETVEFNIYEILR